MNNSLLRALLLFYLSWILLASCTTTMSYTKTSDQNEAGPSTRDCRYQIVSTLPVGSWEELGVFNFSLERNAFTQTYQGIRNPRELKQLISQKVCDQGGSIVVGDINNLGMYIRATVYKELDEKKRL